MTVFGTIGQRDRNYVEDRLTAPCVAAQEASGRLAQCGFKDEAREIDDAIAKFQDECRAIRRRLFYPWHKPSL